MRYSTFVLVSSTLILVSTGALAQQDKRGTVSIDKDGKAGTLATSKDGKTGVGLSAPPPMKPESAQTEADKRQQQQNQGGQVIIRQSF